MDRFNWPFARKACPSMRLSRYWLLTGDETDKVACLSSRPQNWELRCEVSDVLVRREGFQSQD